MHTPDFGIRTEHIESELNETADFLSRQRRANGNDSLIDFTLLVQKYPQLQNCLHFQPSQELLSLLFSSLSTGSVNIPTTRVPLGHLSHDRITT
jgi:hypothetical protein